MKNEVVSPPYYVSADPKEREEFLSQHGNFTPGEREIFHFMCANWEPEIPFGRISAGSNLGLGNKKGEFLGLVAKLRKGRIGLLRTRMENGLRTEAFVILTAEGDRRFYAHLLEEESDRLAEDVPAMPPIERLLANRGVEVPDRHVRSFSYDELIAVCDGRMSPTDAILRLPAAADQSILISPYSVEAYPARARTGLAGLLSDPTLLAAVAKSCDSSVGKLKSVLESDHSTAWAGLTKCLFDARSALETNGSLAVPKALYASAAVVHRVSVARASSDRERVKQEKERLQNLELIAAEVKSFPRNVIQQSELDEILEEYRGKYGSEFESFKDEFYTRYTTPKERRNLAQIQPLGTAYAHRDNLYRVFLDRFQDAQAELYSYYLARMGEFIRGRNGDEGEPFSSHQSFCVDIRARLPKVDSLLGELFRKPFLMAELIIHGEKRRKNVSSIDDVRTILARFFVSDQMELRDFATIFELSLIELFETAYVQLPILSQIWHKITGKYDSLRETVMRRSGSRRGLYRDSVAASSRVEPAAVEAAAASGATGRRGVVSTVGRSRSRKKETQKPRYYTHRDRERAWQQFGEALKQ